MVFRFKGINYRRQGIRYCRYSSGRFFPFPGPEVVPGCRHRALFPAYRRSVLYSGSSSLLTAPDQQLSVMRLGLLFSHFFANIAE
ncbi:hypothetical protein [Photorhabdus viridis]|uniref:hypothetical protein n=1 Tax=Photorhabdus viridis TaxID=3163327 RepID=UPI00330724C3